MEHPTIKGRGSAKNIKNRFEKTHYELDDDVVQADPDPEAELEPSPRTVLLPDNTRTILSENDSPDVGFRYSVNAYRGCEHGCAYCYARPTHEYLGLSAGLDFETKIFVKEKAPELLRERLSHPAWEPQPIAMSGVTDCYQPIERKLRLTRGCLEVLAELRNPVVIITKNQLVTRDLDLLSELGKLDAALVALSVTTLDDELCGKLEPRTSRPRARLRALEDLSKAGVRTMVMVAPVIPGLTDHEMPAILKAAADAGASRAAYVTLRLPGAVTPLFQDWLARHRPDRKERVESHLRSLRDGKLNDSTFGKRMRGEGAFAENLKRTFELFTRKYGLNDSRVELATHHFQRPGQLRLF
ncbi:MAG: PA0069 family radical SAM protein [Deltaproteobacteria bacterium]|nr:PA0069 family radical SAM protein [Deltaproteobacteria bacterium]